jgi:GNAT superfamily N-acetyltransferase
MVKIKLAFIADIPHIIAVADATWKQTYAPILSSEQIEYMYERNYTTETLTEQMQDGNTFLLASEEQQPLGFAAYQWREDNIIYIPKLYIKPDAQRKSVGKLLLEEIERI